MTGNDPLGRAGRGPVSGESLYVLGKHLHQRRNDVLMLLRLGAYSNAIQTQVLAIEDVQGDGPGAERDRLHFLLAALGYLKEAIDDVEQRQVRMRHLLKITKQWALAPVPKWKEIELVLTKKGPNSLYERWVRRVRHQTSFHFQQDVFTKWLDSRDDEEEVQVWDIDNPTGGLFRGSSDALTGAMSPPAAADLEAMIVEARHAMGLLVQVVAAVTVGLFLEAAQPSMLIWRKTPR